MQEFYEYELGATGIATQRMVLLKAISDHDPPYLTFEFYAEEGFVRIVHTMEIQPETDVLAAAAAEEAATNRQFAR
jgi:hypothetical protein